MKPIPRSQLLPDRNRYNPRYVYGGVRRTIRPVAMSLFQEVLPEVLERTWQGIEVVVDDIINGPFIPNPDQGIYHTLFRHSGY
jgi:hypothetical protein